MRRPWMAVALMGTLAAPAAAGPVGGAEHRLLLDPTALSAQLGAPRLRIVDMANDPADYHKGHLPGAVYLHVNDSRIGMASGGYRLPTADEAGRLFSRLGIAPDTHVVIYDDAGGLNAARLFFTLEVFGHPRAAILDGGIQAWRRAGLPVTREAPVIAVAAYRPALRPERAPSADSLLRRLNDPAVAIVDARTPAEYAGTDVRARRGGHIPGAINLDWREHLRPDLTFKPPAALRAMYAARGITPDRTVVTYCQTQHRASHSYFVLRLLGYPSVAGYDRSWAEWGNRDDLPVAR